MCNSIAINLLSDPGACNFIAIKMFSLFFGRLERAAYVVYAAYPVNAAYAVICYHLLSDLRACNFIAIFKIAFPNLGRPERPSKP